MRLRKYIYNICKVVYYDTQFQIALSKLEPRGKNEKHLDQIQVYLSDNSNPFYNIDSCIFHIVVDTRCPRFRESMLVLEQCQYYVGRYQLGHLKSNKCVLLMRHPVPRQWKAFIQSHYSKIYRNADNTIFFINNDENVRSYFREIDKSTGRIQMSKEWHCMMKTDSYFNEHILPLTSGLSDQEIREIKENNEYDDVIDLKQETFTSLEHIAIPNNKKYINANVLRI